MQFLMSFIIFKFLNILKKLPFYENKLIILCLILLIYYNFYLLMKFNKFLLTSYVVLILFYYIIFGYNISIIVSLMGDNLL